MTPERQRTVRMICTDDGRHRLNVLMPWHLDEDGRPEEDPLHPGRTGLERAVYRRQTGRNPAFGEMRCRRCGRNPRITEATLTRLMVGLLERTTADQVDVDISVTPYARIFGG